MVVVVVLIRVVCIIGKLEEEKAEEAVVAQDFLLGLPLRIPQIMEGITVATITRIRITIIVLLPLFKENERGNKSIYGFGRLRPDR